MIFRACSPSSQQNPQKAFLYEGEYSSPNWNTCDNDQKMCEVKRCQLRQNDVSSLYIPAGMKVVLYTKTDFGGDKLELSGPTNADDSCLTNFMISPGRSWNDRASSVKVIGVAKLPALPKDMYARYQAEKWDATARVLRDSSGNNRDSITAAGNINKVGAAVGGSPEVMTFLEGNTGSGIVFPPGSIPTKFTVCSVSRYTSNRRGRILQAAQPNWLHGHWYGRRGVAYFDGWLNYNNMGKHEDWLVMCTKNAASPAMIVDGQYIDKGKLNGGNKQLTINRGAYNEKSDWGVAEIMIWDRHLDLAELLGTDDYLRKAHFSKYFDKIAEDDKKHEKDAKDDKAPDTNDAKSNSDSDSDDDDDKSKKSSPSSLDLYCVAQCKLQTSSGVCDKAVCNNGGQCTMSSAKCAAAPDPPSDTLTDSSGL